MSPSTAAHEVPRLDAAEIASTGRALAAGLARRIVGLDDVVEQVLITVLARGHALLEGVPGLAKTLLLSSMAELLDLAFSRIQFTPDLMPSDVTGSEYLVHDVDTGEREFRFAPGPVFANIVLADEINRAPPKTQAALMEAMEERQVTSLGVTRRLDDPFVVLATQNPIEQQGTYPLPVGQLDRFLFKIHLDYPAFDDEMRIARLLTSPEPDAVPAVLDRKGYRRLADALAARPVPDAVRRHAVELVQATRPQGTSAPEIVREYVAWGAGPRAAQALVVAARIRAALRGRETAAVTDVRALAPAVLRHRLVLNYAADADGKGPDAIVAALLDALRPAGEEAPRPRRWWRRAWDQMTRPPRERAALAR